MPGTYVSNLARWFAVLLFFLFHRLGVVRLSDSDPQNPKNVGSMKKSVKGANGLLSKPKTFLKSIVRPSGVVELFIQFAWPRPDGQKTIDWALSDSDPQNPKNVGSTTNSLKGANGLLILLC